MVQEKKASQKSITDETQGNTTNNPNKSKKEIQALTHEEDLLPGDSTDRLRTQKLDDNNKAIEDVSQDIQNDSTFKQNETNSMPNSDTNKKPNTTNDYESMAKNDTTNPNQTKPNEDEFDMDAFDKESFEKGTESKKDTNKDAEVVSDFSQSQKMKSD